MHAAEIVERHALEPLDLLIERDALLQVQPEPAEAVHPVGGSFSAERRGGDDLADEPIQVVLRDRLDQGIALAGDDRFDLGEALGIARGVDEVLAEAAKFGMARSLSAGLSVLEAEVKPLEGVRSCIQNVDFASRVARYQFARQRSERDNAFLEVALSLACLDRPGLIFRALQGGIQALVRESSLKSLKEDVFQAWEIARGRETKAHPSSESPPLEG